MENLTHSVTASTDLGFLKRRETVNDYRFKTAGKYTTEIRKGNASENSSDLTFDLKGDNLVCPQHFQNKNIFLFADYTDVNPKYTKFSRICINCESDIKEVRGGIESKLYDIIIRQNKSKIKEIREQKTRMGGFINEISQTCSNIVNETVYPLADEFLDICGTFEIDVLSKFMDAGNAEELEKLKTFVSNMQLEANGDPKLEGIGRDKEREREYISLAMFLIYFQGVKDEHVSYAGISESLKSHLLRIIKMRRAFVRKSNEWLRFLVGDFYDFIFTTEGLAVDNNFRSSLQIEHPTEDDFMKMKLYFEQIIKQKDEQISGLLSERETLARLNQEYLNQIEELKNSMNKMRVDFENTLRSRLEAMKNEYENQLRALSVEFNNLKLRFQEMESKYQTELRGLTQERDHLAQQLAALAQKYEADMRALSAQLEHTLKELETLRGSYSTLQAQFNQKVQELTNLKSQYDTLRTENSQLQNRITSLLGELETLRNNFASLQAQFNQKTQEYNSLKANFEALRNENAQLLLKISALLAEIDGLKSNLANVQLLLSQKTQEYNTLKAQFESLRNENGQLQQRIVSLMGELENLKNTLSGLQAQYNQKVQEFNNLKLQFDGLRNDHAALQNRFAQLTSELETLRANFANLQAQYNQKLNELNSLKSQFDALRNENATLRQKVENLTGLVASLSKERDQLNALLVSLRGEIEKLKSLIVTLTSSSGNVEAQLAEAARKYDELMGQYNNLRDELNLKLTLIQKLELSLKQSETNNQNLTSQLNVNLQQIEGYKTTIAKLTRQLEELRVRLSIISERDNEITKLKLTITQCKSEWEKLSESYDHLLTDMKKQLDLNQALIIALAEMHAKIEKHNGNLAGIDLSLRQQIEVLTKEALCKQRMEYSSSTETVTRCQSQLEDLKSRLGRVEGQRLNKSAVFSNITMSVESFQTGGAVVHFQEYEKSN